MRKPRSCWCQFITYNALQPIIPIYYMIIHGCSSSGCLMGSLSLWTHCNRCTRSWLSCRERLWWLHHPGCWQNGFNLFDQFECTHDTSLGREKQMELANTFVKCTKEDTMMNVWVVRARMGWYSCMWLGKGLQSCVCSLLAVHLHFAGSGSHQPLTKKSRRKRRRQKIASANVKLKSKRKRSRRNSGNFFACHPLSWSLNSYMHDHGSKPYQLRIWLWGTCIHDYLSCAALNGGQLCWIMAVVRRREKMKPAHSVEQPTWSMTSHLSLLAC